MTAQHAGRVDRSALRTNQAFIIILLVTAFLVDSWALVAGVALVMLAGTAVAPLSIFKQAYHCILRPAGLVKPDVIDDDPAPHRFAQGFGGVVVAVALVAAAAGLPLAGWGLVALVVVLAALNLFVGFCAGCFLYYQLGRAGVPYFHRKSVG